MNYIEAFTELKGSILNYTQSRHFQPMTGEQWLKEWVYEKGKKKGLYPDEMYEECTLSDEGILNNEGTLAYKIIPCKLVCFDVDGTLGHPKSGGDFRETADDWEFFPGVIEKCHQLDDDGILLITVSNQGGVCFPWSKFTEEQIRAVLDETARTIGAMASLLACSSTHPKALDKYRFDDPRRKPNPGMILEAMKLADITPEETLMVGDRPEDEQAAKNCGVDFMWSRDFFGD